MTRWRNLVFNTSFALNCLLAFLLVFEERLTIPAWLQVGGRMHPVILHFPIVLIVLYVLWLLFGRSNKDYIEISQNILLLTSITAVITALFGLFLSKEQGYDADALQQHKWYGAATAFFALLLIWINKGRLRNKWLTFGSAAALLSVMTIAGDLGGEITHGEDFVLAPVTPQKQKPQVAFEDAFVYADVVQPILETKCMGCHNSKKAKGELIMETKDLLLKGGKNGKLWDTTEADLGLLMHRVHLPEEEKEHMPPAGKPQLSEEEVQILQAWIKSGSDFNKQVTELLPTDTLRIFAAKRLKTSAEEEYSFEAANESIIQELNNTNRVIYPISLESPGLVVNIYNSEYFGSKQLQELDKVKQQVVELNLSNMPVKDEDLKIISGFTNLRILNLNHTAISGSTLGELKKLPMLRDLSLAGTPLKAQHLQTLQTFPKLKNVYLWNTAIDDGMIAKINRQDKIHFVTGFKGDTVVLKLTPPVVLNGDSVFTQPANAQLKHYIKGTAIRYTTDGTDPDSTSSPVFNNDLAVQKSFLLKTRATKPGWYSSDVSSHFFFAATHQADSVQLLQPSDEKYKANGGKTLIDLVKSDASSGTGKWLAYRKNACEAMLFFDKPVTATSVTLSMLKDLGGYIFPPESVEIWGGTNSKQMKLLSRVTPKQPKDYEPNENMGIQCNFKPANVDCIKLVAKPVAKLPKWHFGKGEKAWIFIDEVVVN